MTRKLILPRSALNACYAPHLQAQQRYQIFFGGASSGKSCFLATRLVLDTLSGRNTLIVRNVARTLRTSCLNEVQKAISRLGLSGAFRINRTEMTVTARNNGSQMIFAGLDDVEKIKSITPQNGPLTDVWIEEATEISYNDFKQLDKRLRGQTRHVKRMTLSFNPIYKTHWLYREFFSGFDEASGFFCSPQLLILRTTYRDNSFLTADDIAALESEQDPYFYAVYTLGKWGALGETIFTNWHTEDLSHLHNAEKSLYGLDFGFSSDPCACVKCLHDPARKRVYVLSELYEKGLTNDCLAERLKRFAPSAVITCDSAEPKSIADLRRMGIYAMPAKKGPDSLMHSIQWLRSREIVVDPRCTNTVRELTLYQWKRDRDGQSIRQPQDRDNHLIDALRYALEGEMNARYAAVQARPEW
ncbi:MAG: PBSX family phage terminase large subunit [Clostridia bacterium]|nr:PBSX family phage terminase large subunit [Clostridia bacterium]